MSNTKIPDKVKLRLWVKAGGRCEYEGCNAVLWRDEVTMADMNAAYIAHIVADSPDGPRGDAVLSPKLAAELSNLMLLCDPHHRMIDQDVVRHPVTRLHGMKEAHEARIELLTGLGASKASEVLLYGANIGAHHPHVSVQRAVEAITPNRYPASLRGISLGMVNNSFEDREGDFWKIESENVRRLYAQQVAPRLADGSVSHLSVFAMAPQPLLVLLGSLLSDIHVADVYQLHREPSTWRWQDDPTVVFQVKEPEHCEGDPALIIALSGTVTPDRVTAVLGADTSIWTLSVERPHNDMMRTRDQLQQFRQTIRGLLDRIKARHGERGTLHVFPAMPVAASVELGRVLMPKADLPLRIYDQNSKLGGFVHALDVNARLEGAKTYA